MIKVKFPEQVELKKELKQGDLALIAKVSQKSYSLVDKIFSGTRKMHPKVFSVYDVVVRFNRELNSLESYYSKKSS